MKKKYVLVCLAGLTLTGMTAAAGWHEGLYLGQDDFWRQRIRIEVSNASAQDVEGAPLDLRIGDGAGLAALAGANANALRVCDSNGVEMLWSVRDAAGRPVRKGAIPANATLSIPVECGANAAAKYFAYFDNPSAWPVPDFLNASGSLKNGNLEEGEGGEPMGWSHDEPDVTHKTSWVGERPHLGVKCLKTVVADGAEATWISTRQSHIRIEGGAHYVFRAWVRAENVKGNAGWYLHVGNSKNSMMHGPMANGGGGTFDWKEVKVEFTAPADADRADIGTVLRGTGTAWFDDVSLETDKPGALRAVVSPPEHAPTIDDIGADAAWPDDATMNYRFPIRILNFGNEPMDNGFIAADITPALSRLNGRIDPDRVVVMDGAKTVAVNRIGNMILLPGKIAPHTRRTFHVYFRNGAARPATVESGAKTYAANPALPGGETKEAVSGVARDEYARLLESPANLLKNAGFETGDKVPAEWNGSESKSDRVQMGFETPGLFGVRCARMIVSTNAGLSWRGWHQSIAVKPGRTLLYSGWLKCSDLSGDSLLLHAHAVDARGKVCEENGFQSVGPGITGTHDWTLLQGLCAIPSDAMKFEVHLTTQATGTSWHDGIIVAEVFPARLAAMETRPAPKNTGPVVWPVNAVVKVFRDDAAPVKPTVARITAARNEREPLQLAMRCARAIANVSVVADEPRGSWGRKLPAPVIGIVGYVPVDHPTSYYQSNDGAAWHRKFPTRAGACDGWAGWWPDPILPKASFELSADETQPVWLTFRVPSDAKAGDYSGTVRFIADGKRIAEIPYTVHVWDFALPDEMHLKAIYDARMNGPNWQLPGESRDEVLPELWRFMAERRLCPDTVKPEPKIRFKDGKVEADFAEFDKAAAYYFDTLKFPHMYTPYPFYGFGWGNPPHKLFGQEPYAGTWPYTNADRSVLSAEFKRAYQTCLKVFWDHLKQKGWDKKCTLYISDEPYDHQEPIRKQMIALCDMIREVDPAIPIYSSTWHHQPEWDGHLTVWGLGHDGRVPVEKLDAIRNGGAKLWWTTDGMMCTDTPYCGVERLLPHYCFKYGAEAYEFWGFDWLTYDPYEFGWHSYINQSGQPGHTEWVRYPNGDGYLAYPGKLFGQRAPVPSLRSEQAGEGCEDFEYLFMLRERIAVAKKSGRKVAVAERALADAQHLVTIPNAGGRYSSRILPDPDQVFRVKENVARAIESLP